MTITTHWPNYEEIKKFDVVYTYFPYLDKSGNRVPPDKPHYCLVLDKLGYDPILKANILTMAYGTSSNFTQYNKTDLMVDLNELNNRYQTGLCRNTKFELHNRVPLEYTSNFFTNPKGLNDPLVGSLDVFNEPDLLKKMKKIAK